MQGTDCSVDGPLPAGPSEEASCNQFIAMTLQLQDGNASFGKSEVIIAVRAGAQNHVSHYGPSTRGVDHLSFVRLCVASQAGKFANSGAGRNEEKREEENGNTINHGESSILSERYHFG